MKPIWIPTRATRLLAIVLVVLGIPAIGFGDLVTGPTASVTDLYLVPVIAAAWFLGRVAGMAASVFAACAALAADYILPGRSLEPVELWNAGSQLVIFGLAAGFASQVRAMLQARDELIAQLDKAAREIKTLHGLLPICAWCKRIRDESQGGWKPLDRYLAEHSHAEFTHGICPDCAEKILPDPGSSDPGERR